MNTAKSNSGRGLLGAVVGLFVIATLQGPALGQAPAGAPQAKVATVGAATVRTAAQMETDDAAYPNLNPSGIEVRPFLPTMDFSQYVSEKAAAQAGQRPDPGAVSPLGPPVQGPASCNGIGQLAPVAGNLYPPDTHGAVGATQFTQIVNSAIRVYSKALTGNCPTSIDLNVSLAAFFGYFIETLFDPRVVYDLTYNRWIVTAEAFPEPGGAQYQFVAVSASSNGAGPYYITQIEMAGWMAAFGYSGGFWDFPQLGYDEDAIMITGNVFDPGFVDNLLIFLPKHRLYNNLPYNYAVWGGFGGIGTLAPPIVLDQGAVTNLAISNPGGDNIVLFKFSNTSRINATFNGSAAIPVTGGITVPPDASQPGTSEKLDTLDARFQNASTQSGLLLSTRLWNTHTDVASGLPTPRLYKINTVADTIEQQCIYFASATSHDFNPSVAANSLGKVFITWSSTSPTTNAQVRFTGKLDGDPCITLLPGTANNTSTNPLTGNPSTTFGVQRWGDYSAVSIDPSDPNTAWAVNEKVQTLLPGQTATTWKSRFFNMSNP